MNERIIELQLTPHISRYCKFELSRVKYKENNLKGENIHFELARGSRYQEF